MGASALQELSEYYPQLCSVGLTDSCSPGISVLAELRSVFCCPGVGQASAVQDLMGYFLSDAVQQNLTGYTFMPVPPALVAAGRQAVASMTINQTATQTRGGQAAVPAASGNNPDTLLAGTFPTFE